MPQDAPRPKENRWAEAAPLFVLLGLVATTVICLIAINSLSPRWSESAPISMPNAQTPVGAIAPDVQATYYSRQLTPTPTSTPTPLPTPSPTPYLPPTPNLPSCGTRFATAGHLCAWPLPTVPPPTPYPDCGTPIAEQTCVWKGA